MDAKARTVSEILHAGEQYLIPFFQRQYSWTQKHWERLRDDLWVLAGDDTTSQHFLGPLVCTPTEHVPGEVTPYQLIDGQQRLTTLTVLLSAIRDIAKGHGLPLLAEEITDNFLVHKYRKGVQRYKVMPRAVDRDALIAVVEGQVGKIHETFGVCRAWRFFQGQVQELVKDDPEKMLRRLFVAVSSRLSLVVITITGENPYEIFESLNSTGLPLEESDLIRNYLFMQVPQPAQDSFQAQHWRSFEAMFSENDSHEATLFYRNYLMRSGVYSKAKSTFVDFKAENKRRQMRPEDQVVELTRYANFEVQLRHPDRSVDKELQAAFVRLAQLEITTAHPLLLNLMDRHEKDQLSREDLLGCLHDLTSFAIRRSICGDSTRTYGQWFPEAIKCLSSNPREDLRGYLLKRGWPDDQTFTQRLQSFALYRREGKKCRLILDALEEFYGHKEQVNPDTLTIEHVMPQTLKKGGAADGWRLMLGANWKDTHERLLHTLGNLTLSGYNPELSNGPFDVKKQHYAKSNLILNRYFAGIPTWDEQAMLERGRRLAAEVAVLWPRPQSDIAYMAPQSVSDVPVSDDLRQRYWTQFLASGDWSGVHRLPPPSARGWIRFVMKGSAVRLLAFQKPSKHRVGVAISCRGNDGKPMFAHFKGRKAEIEAITGPLAWEDHANGTSYIMMTKDADVADEAAWPEQHLWLQRKLKSFQGAFSRQMPAKSPSGHDAETGTGRQGAAAVTQLIVESGQFELLHTKSNVWFMPRSWASILPDNGTAWRHLSRQVSIACWFEFWEGKLLFHMEASRMSDPNLSLLCMEKLQQAGFTPKNTVIKKYCRFFLLSRPLVDKDNAEAVRVLASTMLKDAEPWFPKAEKVFREVFQKRAGQGNT